MSHEYLPSCILLHQIIKILFLASTSFLAVAGLTSILGSSEQRLSFSQEYDSLAFVKGRDMTLSYQHVSTHVFIFYKLHEFLQNQENRERSAFSGMH